MQQSSGLTQRRNVKHEERTASEERMEASAADEEDEDSKETRLTLMEEILLLGLKDREGYTSFWNDCISSALRGCVLIELGLRGRIDLETMGMRRKSVSNRKIVCKNPAPCGDVLLDEALKYIKETDPPETTQTWIEYLSGETWNPIKLRYQLRQVRERLAKNLAEKGVLTTEKQNFLLFDMTTHPLVDATQKQKLVQQVQQSLLSRWPGDLSRVPRRQLALVLMAHAADVLENALSPLPDDEYELASTRLRQMLAAEPDTEIAREGQSHVLWAVIAVFRK